MAMPMPLHINDFGGKPCDFAFDELLKRIASMHYTSTEELEDLRRQNSDLRLSLEELQSEVGARANPDQVQVEEKLPDSNLPSPAPKSITSTSEEMTSNGKHLPRDTHVPKFAGRRPSSLSIETQPYVKVVPNKPAAGQEEDSLCRATSRDVVTSASLPSQLARQVSMPEDLQVRKAWEEVSVRWNRSKKDTPRRSSVRGTSRKSMRQSMTNGSFTEDTLVQDAANKRCSRFILSPSDQKRVAWDLAGMILLAYDVMYIPLSAFELEPNVFTDVMEWVTLLFWTGDVGMSLITGYVSKGILVLSPGRILLTYLKTWFLLDLAVVGPDWAFTVLVLTSPHNEEVGSSGNISKLFRSLRVMRTVRLLRLVKLRRLIALAKDRITSEIVFIVLNIIKLIVMLLLVNHFIASAWYLTGSMSGSPNWIEIYELTERDKGYKYLTSLHWSLTQFTPASMHVQPENSAERVFALVVLIFGLVLFSSFISSITASMTQLRNMQDDQSKQFWLLRRYLAQRKVPTNLCFKILRYCEYATSNSQDLVPESRILVLSNLTPQLRNELRFVTSFYPLKNHAMFGYLAHSNEVMMHRLSHKVFGSLSLAAGDPLFSAAEPAGNMYLVQKGSISYFKDIDLCGGCGSLTGFGREPQEPQSPTSLISNDQAVPMAKDEYLCEISFWVEDWFHCGTAIATADANLISIDADGFAEKIGKDAMAWESLSVYARAFVEFLQSQADLSTVECSLPEVKEFTFKHFANLQEEMALTSPDTC